MITTPNGVFFQDDIGQWHYLSDWRKGGTAVQWAQDALENLPTGMVWFWAGRKAVPIDPTESYWDLYTRWWRKGLQYPVQLQTCRVSER